MSSVDFFVAGKPVAKQRARVVRNHGKVRSFTPEATVNYELQVRMCAQEAMSHRKPFEQPCALTVTVYVHPPQSWSNKRRKEAVEHEYRPTKKPDLSNILKSIEDGMNGVVYRDDSQIVAMSVAKQYSEWQGVSVTVRELDAKPAP